MHVDIPGGRTPRARRKPDQQIPGKVLIPDDIADDSIIADPRSE